MATTDNKQEKGDNYMAKNKTLEKKLEETITEIIGEDRAFMDVPDIVGKIVQNVLQITKQQVVILVNGGVVEIPKAPPGTTVIVRDYDVDGIGESFLKKDSSGSFYTESTYEF